MSVGLEASPLDSLVALRRDLHRHPELRFAEHRTASVVAARLRAAGLRVETGRAGTGVVAVLGDGGPHVLLRADIDALPTDDLKPVPYRSTAAGVAHACGHDVHTAVVVGVAERLASGGLPSGRVSFVFQPAEEIPFGEPSGGASMLETGVLDDVDVVLGLHCWPWLAVGVIGVDREVAMASKLAFGITLAGTGAHAAVPSEGRDAILAASHVVGALHQLVAREIDPGTRATLNVGTIRGGRSQSIVPSAAELTGTIRSADAEAAQRLRQAVERVVRGVSAAVGVDATVEWKNEMPAVMNDQALVARALRVLSAADLKVQPQVLTEPPMTADDFALYAAARPGLYLKLGTRALDGSIGGHPLHDGRFDVDERAIGVGVRGFSALIEDLLARPVESADD